MRISTSVSHALSVCAVFAILAACNSGSQVAPAGPAMGTNIAGGVVDSLYASLIPEGIRSRGAMPLVGRPAPDIAKRGIYVSIDTVGGTEVFGYKKRNKANDPPFCTPPFTVSYPYDIAVDGAGNLITSNYVGSNHFDIIIGQGPNMCGAEAATISDTQGYPRDFSSANALTGTIAAANDLSGYGGTASIMLCTLSGGCTVFLTNPEMYRVFGVAMDNRGNCWGDGINFSGAVTLTYFAGCAGSGVQATGFINLFFSGIDIDTSGNLVTADETPGTGKPSHIYVYSGCKPACTLLSSTQTIGFAEYLKLNKRNTELAASDVTNQQIDIYRYSPTGVTYLYSFNNGLSGTNIVGVAYNKRSPQ